MIVYNINLGIGWASSGVEYAQAYRAQILRRIQQPAKFIFMDMITQSLYIYQYIQSTSFIRHALSVCCIVHFGFFPDYLGLK